MLRPKLAEDVTITEYLAVRTYTPDVTAKDKHHLLPVGIYFHGGGWCCGDLDSEDNFCRMLAKALPLIVVSVSYRLAPEHKAPAQVRDAVDAWTWVRLQLAAKKKHATADVNRLSKTLLDSAATQASTSPSGKAQVVHLRLPYPTSL